MKFSKYHALGNDYIVINPVDMTAPLTVEQIKRICHRNLGVGSDGILLGPSDSCDGVFSLRIFNPDGSEAEKSGNGLRIFSRYLWDKGLVKADSFPIQTLGGEVSSQVSADGKKVFVEMGRVSFQSTKIPVEGPSREVLNESIIINKTVFNFCAATIGNPHCVILRDCVSPEETKRIGPSVEIDPRFPNRTNVQFMKIIDRSTIQIEIWERGAGYTLASGSSGSASAAVAHRLGLCDDRIAVHMPGGTIDITLAEDFSVSMSGPVTKICEGFLDEDMFENIDKKTAI
jgi:diaminopimelate epimerase